MCASCCHCVSVAAASCHVLLLFTLINFYIFWTPFSAQVRGIKGPIFEDGPNFDTAFRLFHGRDGVVPLSERSFVRSEKEERELAPCQFHPLAAKAATISLSSFGLGGPFSFDSFSEKWKNQKKKSESSKKESSSKVIHFQLCHDFHTWFCPNNLNIAWEQFMHAPKPSEISVIWTSQNQIHILDVLD